MIVLVDVQDGIIEYAGKVYVEIPDGCVPVFMREEDVVDFDEFADLVPVKQTYDPRAEYRGLYAALLEQFKAAFRNTQPIVRALNRPGFGTRKQ